MSKETDSNDAILGQPGAEWLAGQGLDPREPNPEVPDELIVLPIREAVIFPGLIAPLSVTRAPSIRAIDAITETEHRIVGAITQLDPDNDHPEPKDLYTVGCAAVIRTVAKMSDATRMIVQGIVRFKVLEVIQTEPYIKVRIEKVEESEIAPEIADEIEAQQRVITQLFHQAVELSPNMPDDLRRLTDAVNEPGTMVDLVAAHMHIDSHHKQRVLEQAALLDRQKVLIEILAREVRVLELGSRVMSEVSQELTRNQRDHFLREQLRAIQRELGESDPAEDQLDDIADRLVEAQLPAEAMKEASREMSRLRRINPSSPEYSVALTYLETLVAMPWEKRSDEKIELDFVKQKLDEEHSGLEKIKDRILDFLSVRKLSPDKKVRQPILCFVGPPGVGKTSLGRSIATSIGREFARISLGGMRDEAEIRGHRRTYIGALPGQVVQTMRRVGVKNPVVVLDEIDKLASDFRGDPASALLEVLDPEQNNSFRDHYLDTPFDLSEVFFIATANRLDTIPPALRDRMEVIEIQSYTELEKMAIARKHLWPKVVRENALRIGMVGISDDAIRTVIHGYTREAGVRTLERELGGLVRKAARQFAVGRKSKINITPAWVRDALGYEKVNHDALDERADSIGVAVGLAWTPVGGEVLFIEAASSPGTGLQVTGQLGDVMKESISAALTFLKSNAEGLKIDLEGLEKTAIHLHVPAGAVPKDGPSAGISMLVALTSLLTKRKVKPKLAMTGELTLTGQVLAVGGIKEKVLAAHRAGATHLILPKANESEYREDVPTEVRAKLDVKFVKSAHEVLEIAFKAPKK